MLFHENTDKILPLYGWDILYTVLLQSSNFEPCFNEL